MSALHLIRFPNKKELKRGIMALLDVPRLESLGLPDLQMVVTDEHIEALEKAKVAFRYLSKTPSNDRSRTPLKSLSKLVSGIKPDNLHGEWDTGPAVGREVL
jgi:antitoxin component of MazEF toxin-antitoxin module